MRRKAMDSDSATALALVGEERNMELMKQKQQEERESLIAKTHQMIGQIRASEAFGKFANVSSLIWLQQVKEAKIYRDLPGVGTWEDFCNSVGMSRQKVDLDLQNLATFGEEFLLTVSSLSVGYRDLRKLRQLSHDGTVIIDADAIVIGEERIPLDPDHREDLQAAIENILTQQTALKEEMTAQKKAYERVQGETHKSLTRLQKEVDKFTADAEAKGLTPTEDAFLQKIEKHRILVQGSLIALEPAYLVDGFDGLTPRMKAKAIATVHELKMQILALYDTTVTEIGDSTINPEMLEDFEKWEQENGFK